MSWQEEQQEEIEIIRERKITVKLSDADCDRLAKKCGEYGLTIGELIENFVGDLVDGTYSNGTLANLYHEFKESNENKIRKELDELKKRIEELENNNR